MFKTMTTSAECESAVPCSETRTFCADGLFAITAIILAIFLTYFRIVRFDCWSIGSCPTRRVMSLFGFWTDRHWDIPIIPLLQSKNPHLQRENQFPQMHIVALPFEQQLCLYPCSFFWVPRTMAILDRPKLWTART